ncbi:hypothetical protein O3M35_009334 [Rhynocoris fuscipes]|uniref:Cytochrome P450 n=1 Tax=Rhynocoris fuscipes TaxID=488301 RepID=A0AAW1D636_9HEMI
MKQYCHDIKRISELIMRRELNAWLRNGIVFTLSPTGKEFTAVRNRLYNFTNQVIAERRKIIEETRNNNNQTDVENKKEPKIFLDCLLEFQSNGENSLSNSDIREEVDTFIFEGHDTTSAAILFSLYSLATHKHVQDKAMNELNQIFGSDQRAPTLNDIKQMQYLERVIKESLRLYPSVPMISRQLTQDLHLDGDIVIPATTNVILIPYFLHRNTNIYPDADKFDPDRFLPENMKHLHPYAYIPFSAGPRNCIGQKFAMLELKVILSTILRNTEIASSTKAENLSLAPLLILRNLNKILMTFQERRSLTIDAQ